VGCQFRGRNAHGKHRLAGVVNVSQTYVNTSIVLWEEDEWKTDVTPGGVGGPSVIFHLNNTTNIYANIDAAKAFVERWQQAINRAEATETRMRKAELHDLAGL
jgi:hypothetical protein